MTYNILMGGWNGSDLRRVVCAAAPDVLLVNESPKTPFLWKQRCHGLAERWGMQYVVGGRSAGSNMIVVRHGVQVKASGAETLRQPLFQPRRGIAWAQLRVEGRLVGVVVCHLSLDARSRLVETRRVIDVAEKLRGPTVIGGDLNERPDGPCWRLLRGVGFQDYGNRGWLTFPATEPAKRIDALVVRGVASIAHHGDPGIDPELLADASDHRPVVLDLTLG